MMYGRMFLYFQSAGTQPEIGVGGTKACRTSHSAVRLPLSRRL